MSGASRVGPGEWFDPGVGALRGGRVVWRGVVATLVASALASAASADVTLFAMEGRLETVVGPTGETTVSLLAGGPLGLGGLAGGRATTTATQDALWLAGTEEVSGVEPTPFFPVGQGDYSGIQPTPFAPDDARVLRFDFDRSGNFMGIQPTPFRVFLFTPGGLVGELLFDDASADQGSLILGGVMIDEAGTVSEVPAFTIVSVPQPLPALPFGVAIPATLLGIGGALVLRRAARIGAAPGVGPGTRAAR